MDLLEFHNGSKTTQYVAPKKNYKSPQEFISHLESEFDRCFYLDDIYTGYVRFFRYPPESTGLTKEEFPDGGYFFVDKPNRGVMEVYVVDA